MALHRTPGPGAGRAMGSLLRLLQVGAAVLLLVSLVACSKRLVSTATPRMKTFVSQNFFSLDHPGDWVSRDLPDGANLFFADELIFVRVNILEPPDPRAINDFMAQKIKADADLQGGQYTLQRTGTRGANPFSHYLITKPNGHRIEEILLYNDELKLLYVMFGSSRPEDFDEFTKIFAGMFESFQFRVTARLPQAADGALQAELATIPGIWTTFLEGVRTEDYDLLQKTSARVNGSKIINDANVRAVKSQYFPYASPLYTFVSHIEVRDRLATARIALRALPPEGFLKHETREFIKEDDHWRLLRFERLD